ncbi:hypothetical protein [Kribbella sp. VKM Ac-2566]|uniref:hypothetical protein n=1 Tax=Kribbella sp. VKM Ac-2566 TaxID=2512218 RepID=UPI001063BBB2|nr:hypothetical protein [Kribbella sp. VKM Ac-2566]TDW88795.1 hypothetical protein EV647_5805 [Kribbella sp. VKM Ac-2566]
MTETEIWRIQLLDWLFDFRPANPGHFAKIVDFLDEDERTDGRLHGLLRGILHRLRDEDLITLAEGMGFDGLDASITAAGMADVEARRERRHDPALRNSAARDATLRWINRHPRSPDPRDMLVDRSTYYEGQPLEIADLTAALEYLLSKDLVTGVTKVAEFVLLEPELTSKGIDCVEQYGGSVSVYLKRGGEGGGTQHNVNFHGPVSGNVAWASETVTQTATTTGIAGDELAVLVHAIIEAIPSLGLPAEESAKLARELEVIDAELVTTSPDAGVVQTFMRRVLATVGGAANSALAAVLMAYAKDQMRKLGIPIE